MTFILTALTILCISTSAQMDGIQGKIEIVNVSSESDNQAIDYLEPLYAIQPDVVPSEKDDQSPWLRYTPILAALVMVVLSLIALIWITKGLATSKKGVNAIIRLGFTDVLISVAVLALWWITLSKSLIVIAPIILAYVTFFGFMSISQAIGGEWSLNRGGMRGAITSTIIVVYFFIISMAIFDPFWGKVPPYMQTIMEERGDHLPGQLSGGEMQRVAIGRALINDPHIILADEPTGNLDSATSLMIFDLFRELNRKGLTLVIVTHNKDLARWAEKMYTLRDGKIRVCEIFS